PPRSPLVPYTTLFRSAAQARETELEEELLQLAQIRDEHLAFVVDEEVGLARVRGRERPLGQVVDEVRGRAEGVLDEADDLAQRRDRKSTRLNSSHVSI